jgi:hypothetical protein
VHSTHSVTDNTNTSITDITNTNNRTTTATMTSSQRCTVLQPQLAARVCVYDGTTGCPPYWWHALLPAAPPRYYHNGMWLRFNGGRRRVNCRWIPLQSSTVCKCNVTAQLVTVEFMFSKLSYDGTTLTRDKYRLKYTRRRGIRTCSALKWWINT